MSSGIGRPSIQFILLLLIMITVPMSGLAADRPTVGAIRWDAWFDWRHWNPAESNRFERYLAPKAWHERLPFYAKVLPDGAVTVRGNAQETVDREIVYASGAGVDYWAFDWYHPKSFQAAAGLNDALRLYRASAKKGLLRYCLLIQSNWLGPKDEWDATASDFVEHFRDSRYMTVCGGRPLAFLNYVENLEKSSDSWKGGKRGFGSTNEARKALDALRKKASDAGLPNPYLVANIYYTPWHTRYVDLYGLDAVCSYSANATGPGTNRTELPYRELMRINRDRWELYRGTGKQVIPPLNTGWDYRAMLADPKENAAGHYQGPWFAKPTPAELEEHVRGALDWVRANPLSCEADTVLVYAWNECAEGSWVLVPTLAEGTSRLDAVSRALKKR